VILDAGWRAVYDAVPDDADDKKDSDESEDAVLPPLSKGQTVQCVTAEAEEKKTKPPAHFNENTLLGAMETAGRLIDDDELRDAMKEGGLGTPATRANIIETLIRRDYIERKGKKLIATAKGVQTIELLGEHPLASPELTGLWEKKLTEVAKGELDRDTFMAMIRTFTATDVVEQISELSSSSLGAPPVDNLCACPRCGEPVKETARAFGCSSWKSKEDPGCGFTLWKEIAGRRLSADEARELITNGRTAEEVSGFISKAGNSFSARLVLGEDGKVSFDFPERSEQEPVAEGGAESIGACPRCGKGVVQTPRAFSCSSWKSKEDPGCGLTIWKEVAKRQLKPEEVQELLANGKTSRVLEGFVSSKGNPFAAFLVLGEDGKTSFEFPPRNGNGNGAPVEAPVKTSAGGITIG
jgi:DNA topoisomerase-3